VKEELCYVSTDFHTALLGSKRKAGSGKPPPSDPFGSSLRRFFVLPDYQKVMRGFVKGEDAPADADEQLLAMEAERFSVPEV
jgi:hypothetical protein